MMLRKAEIVALSLTFACLAEVSCGEWQVSTPPASGGEGGEGGEGEVCTFDLGQRPVAPAPMGLRVAGNRIVDGQGNDLVLRGVNRSGSEYACIQGGLFDGPGTDSEGEMSVRAIAAWNVNAVRVPLNESCWLAIGGAPEIASGENYKAAIVGYVALLQRYGLVPILDLHWAAPGNLPANGLQPMPNADNTPAFWSDVALTFMGNSGVIFEVYNEPYPDFNRDTPEAWACWRDGCEATRSGIPPGDTAPSTYQAAGMQALVDAIRETGSTHVILLGGVQYSNALSGWLDHRPDDPLDQLGAAWHIYNFNGCRDESCWSGAPAALAAEVPVVATEIGQNDCEGGAFLQPLLHFLDAQRSGYLAWSWNAALSCTPEDRRRRTGNPWPLIRAYECPEPNGNYARTFYDHLQGAAP